MLISRLIATSLALGILPTSSLADNCVTRDFLTLPLKPNASQNPIASAIETAYPGLRASETRGILTYGNKSVPFEPARAVSPRERLSNATVSDQFFQIYPLDFDITKRAEPWFDPGRVRNDAFFRMLYGDTEVEVAKQLRSVRYNDTTVRARFAVTGRHCAARQLIAALDALSDSDEDFGLYFKNIGGSFNWRSIAGTNRLSVHSFGIAVDFNTQIGGYWRWSGAAEGNVGSYDNKYPQFLVEQMERFGFIWGGKWHHFDGMHFEYRPELILYSRLKTASEFN